MGVAEDADAAILVRKINGLYWNGHQLYVEDVRQQKVSNPTNIINPKVTMFGCLCLNIALTTEPNWMKLKINILSSLD